jgi:hypothetical protein
MPATFLLRVLVAALLLEPRRAAARRWQREHYETTQQRQRSRVYRTRQRQHQQAYMRTYRRTHPLRLAQWAHALEHSTDHNTRYRRIRVDQQIRTATSQRALSHIVELYLRHDADNDPGETYAETAQRYSDTEREADAALFRLAETRWWELMD